MTEAVVIFSFWFLGGVLGHIWMRRLIVGFPSRMAVDVLAISWGIVVAFCARFIIVSLHTEVMATVVTYFVGAVVSGTTRALVNWPRPMSRFEDETRMTFDYTYYKKEALAFIPRIVYAIASVMLFFVWT